MQLAATTNTSAVRHSNQSVELGACFVMSTSKADATAATAQQAVMSFTLAAGVVVQSE